MAARAEFVVVARLLAETSQMLAQTRRALNKVEKRSKSTTRRIARAAGRAFRKVGTVAGGGLAVAAVAGARSAINLQRTLGDIEIQSGASKDEMALLADAIKATSKATAISRGELALTSKRLVDLLGPAGRSAELMDLLGRTAVASGADTAELAGLISAVSDSMGIAADDTVRMESALSAFLAAGKVGKVPLEEMAIVLQDISSTFKDVSTGGPAAAADLAAALQVARKSFGSAAKAGTGLEAFISALIKKSAALKKLKVEVFTGKGAAKKLLPFRDILDQIQERGLNVQELTEALGRKEAAKFAKILTSEEGRKEFERIATAARGATDVSDDFGKRTEAAVFKVDQALNNIKGAFTDAFSEEDIEGIATAFQNLAGAAGTLANVVSTVAEGFNNIIKLGDVLINQEPEKRASEARQKANAKTLKQVEELQAKAGAAFRADPGGIRGTIDPKAAEAAELALRESLLEVSELRGAERRDVVGFGRQQDIQKAARARLTEQQQAVLALSERTFEIQTEKGAERFKAGIRGREEFAAPTEQGRLAQSLDQLLITASAKGEDVATQLAADIGAQGKAGLAQSLNELLAAGPVVAPQGSEALQKQQELINATAQQTTAVLSALAQLGRDLTGAAPAPRSTFQRTGGGGRGAPLETGTR